MKKTLSIFALMFLFSVITINASAQKSQVTVFDGEMYWPSFTFSKVIAVNDTQGNIVLWAAILQTQIGNSSRTVSFSTRACAPGAYSAIYNPSTQQWSNSAIANVVLNVDYDGKAYPTWNGQSATLTINKYNKKKKRIDATLNAVVVMEGTNNTRTIQIVMKDLDVSGK